ncbi:MAG TPA: ABC transporter permease [Gemmatimonadales bacterium]|nr:ABC transporter permease [Gemmatimonadales bacterium]
MSAADRPGARKEFRLPQGAGQIKADVEEEIRFHLEMRVADLVRQGLSPAAAREEALRRFGDVERARAEMNAADRRRVERTRRRELLQEVVQDIAHALRQLRRRPAFALVTMLTLAVGIGANTAVFSAADHVALRPLPFTDYERVVTLWESDARTGQDRKEVSPGNFVDWRDRAQTFESMALMEPYAFDLGATDGPPLSLRAWGVTEGFFETMGAPLVMGRSFTPQEHAPNAPLTVVISFKLWQQRFGSDPRMVGRTIDLDQRPATVLGVAPPWLRYPDDRDLWAPKRWHYDGERTARRSSYMFAIGRLRPGVALAQARAELDAIGAQMATEYPATNTSIGITAVPIDEQLLGDVRPALFVLLVAVGFVLLIACANVASLLLARAAERGRELAVRAALGADRGRLTRQLATESLLLAVIGGAGGIGLAYAGIRVLVALAPEDLPRVESVALDGRVLVFATLVTLLTALLFGLAPSLRASRPDLLTPLRAAGRSIFGGHERNTLRRTLVVGEVALALVLLIGAGLLVRSFTSLLANDLGFASENRATFQTFLWDLNPTAEQRLQRLDAITAAFTATPGVEAVGITTAVPFHPSAVDPLSNLVVEDRPPQRPGEEQRVHTLIASDGYFQVMGIPLVAGRGFTPSDRLDAPRVAVINQTTARRYFAEENPVGKRVSFGVMGPPQSWEIVGVVGDVRPHTFDSDPRAEVLVPLAQTANGGVTFVVKTRENATNLMPSLRAAFWAGAPGQSIYYEATVQDLIADTLVERRFSLVVLGAFSLVALVLATIGVYGLISYSMSQRTSEISVRMALGARAGEIVRMVVRDALALAIPGLAVGAVSALLLTRFMRSMLYQVAPADPLVYGQLVLLVLVVSAAAAYAPARRAASLDPAKALRED